ncbi:MAG: glutaredoxin family protein [Deltaproteobacteria bacterium]|nr:MAG: glutaredoxin family protein [Deltaproteobacteria bacterium]
MENKEDATMSEKVKIYSTPGCPYCKMAKEFLLKKGVEFIDYDVKKDKEALKEMKKISGGALSVPVISVCNEVMVGFDRGRLEQALSCLKQSSKIE